MLKYFINRLLMLIPSALVISFMMFVALEFTPGDPVTATMSPDMIASLSEDDLDAIRESLGLNDPMLVRYGRWIGGIVTGDMGNSIQTGTPIADIISNLLPATIRLGLFSLIIAVVFGLLFGILAAINQNNALDYLLSVFGVVGISVPEFFVGIVAMLVFAIKLGWFPAQGRTDIGLTALQSMKYLVLPGMALCLIPLAALTRYTRNSMLDVLHKDYVKTARAKGLPEWKVYLKHAFRNSLMPISVMICMRIPLLIGSSVVIEQVFGYAGIGTRLMTAINANDYQLVLIIVLLLSVVSLFASVLIDLLTAILDPRVRLGKKAQGGA